MEARKAAKPSERPFYAAPDNVTISSQIINEARSSLRTLRTQRPFTPSEENRTLFGTNSVRNPEARPPSAFSLRSEHFDRDSRPVSGTRDSRPVSGTRDSRPVSGSRPVLLGPLAPIDQKSKPDVEVIHRRGSGAGGEARTDSEKVSGKKKLKPAPPPVSSDVENGASRRSTSGVETRPRSGSNDSRESRRVRSGPKERTGEPVQYEDVDGRSNSASADTRRRPSSPDLQLPNLQQALNQKPASQGPSQPADQDSDYFAKKVQPILDQMTDSKGDTKTLLQLSELLYVTLLQGNFLGKRFAKRSAILKVVFRYLDSGDIGFLLCLSRIILALEVSGNNLLNVCKLMFKLCKSEENDEFFADDPQILGQMINLMANVDPGVSGEALVYLIGSVKLLSGSSKVIEQLAQLKTVESAAKLMERIIGKTVEKNQKDQIGHILVQLTAAVRNLADSGGSRQKILQNNVIELLCQVLHQHQHDADIVLNISRILSKLTLHTDCCERLAGQPQSFSTFLLLLTRHVRKEDIVVRMSFILGNLTAKSERARLSLYEQNKSLDTIMHVFRVYIETDLKLGDEPSKPDSKSENQKETDNRAGKIEDVLVKIVRVIANLSVSEEIGPVLASYPLYAQLLLHILERKSIQKSEELVLNTVATINNLTYYLCQDSGTRQELLLEIAEALLKLFHVQHMDGLSESARVYGNLSRHQALRDFMHERHVDRMLVAVLDSGSRECVYTACGVLINLMVDDDKRSVLKNENGVGKLVDVLRDFGRNDWQLATMVCQILWNYSSRMKSAQYLFGDVEGELCDVLVEYLDEQSALTDRVLASMDEDTQDYVRDVWDTEFCPVAQQLLNRLEKYASKFEPLEGPGS